MLRNNRVIRWRRNAIMRLGFARNVVDGVISHRQRVFVRMPGTFLVIARRIRQTIQVIIRVIVTRRPAFQIIRRNRRAIGHRKNIANLVIAITQRHEVAAAGLIRIQRCKTTVFIVVSVIHRRRVAISHTRALAKLVIPHEVQVGVIVAGLNAVDVLNKPARIIIKIKDFAVRVNERLQPVPGVKRKRGRVHFRRVFRVTFGVRINRARFFNDFTKQPVFAFRQPRFIGDCHNAIGAVKRSPRIAIRISNIVFAKLRIGDRVQAQERVIITDLLTRRTFNVVELLCRQQSCDVRKRSAKPKRLQRIVGHREQGDPGLSPAHAEMREAEGRTIAS